VKGMTAALAATLMIGGSVIGGATVLFLDRAGGDAPTTSVVGAAADPTQSAPVAAELLAEEPEATPAPTAKAVPIPDRPTAPTPSTAAPAVAEKSDAERAEEAADRAEEAADRAEKKSTTNEPPTVGACEDPDQPGKWRADQAYWRSGDVAYYCNQGTAGAPLQPSPMGGGRVVPEGVAVGSCEGQGVPGGKEWWAPGSTVKSRSDGWVYTFKCDPALDQETKNASGYWRVHGTPVLAAK
jgi:hypothetical protein